MANYEEKYKNALSQAKQAIDNIPDKSFAEWLQNIFPELKESEDEKIRKVLIKYLKERLHSGFNEEVRICNDGIAWLEKQGEQKPTDNVEPKFKVGDWIVEPREDEPDYLWHIDRIKNDVYWYDAVNSGVEITHADKNYHLWSIEDASDGDVLAYPDNTIVLFKTLHKGNDEGLFTVHCLYFDDIINVTTTCAVANIHPATKEQRDLLFQKMREAGYEWDIENKRLKEIEQEQTVLPKGEDYGIDSLYHAATILEKTLGEVDGYQTDDGILEHECVIEAVKRLCEKKSNWSKEDESIFNDIMHN